MHRIDNPNKFAHTTYSVECWVVKPLTDGCRLPKPSRPCPFFHLEFSGLPESDSLWGRCRPFYHIAQGSVQEQFYYIQMNPTALSITGIASNNAPTRERCPRVENSIWYRRLWLATIRNTESIDQSGCPSGFPLLARNQEGDNIRRQANNLSFLPTVVYWWIRSS